MPRKTIAAAPEPCFQPTVISRYRVALVREEDTPYDQPKGRFHPPAAARFLHELLADWDREVAGAIFLDTRGRAIEHQIAYVGTLNRAAVEPRGFLSAALLANAAGIIVFHSHPSGDPTPSFEDLEFTRQLAAATSLLGIRFVDHIIVGEKPRYVSLKGRVAW